MGIDPHRKPMGGKPAHSRRRNSAPERPQRGVYGKPRRSSDYARYARVFPHFGRFRRVRCIGIPLAAAQAIPLREREGMWQPYPVEYKRGAPKEHTADTLQLCGQAMCLEEMLCCDIPQGALYYGEIHRRSEVTFTPELRQEVRALLAEMHSLYAQGKTPKVKPTKACGACSLKELCLPKLMRSKSVSSYLRHAMEESP